MGLPDVEQANRIYMDNLVRAMKEAPNLDQLQGLAGKMAPMGQMGLKMFQSLMESGAAFTSAANPKKGAG